MPAKKSRPLKDRANFAAICSSCDDADKWWVPPDGLGWCKTRDEAKASVADVIEEYKEGNGGQTPGAVFIIQVIDEGKPEAGVSWEK